MKSNFGLMKGVTAGKKPVNTEAVERDIIWDLNGEKTMVVEKSREESLKQKN